MSLSATVPPALPPDERNRVVDLVRVLALVLVVVGHWLKQGWYVDDVGALHRAGLLGTATWTHPLTWVFQVMPLFFVVGGYVNALSWRHARQRGTTYGTWLAGRVGRLTRPVLPLLAFWLVAAPVAPLVGLEDEWSRIASKSALLPLWFLATYVVVVALVPATLAAWERWGRWTLAVGAVAVLVDTLGVRLDSMPIGALNMLVVWGTLHQLGYAWRDEAFPRSIHAALLGTACLAANVLLVTAGPYGVSMVGVDGHGLNNTNPPRATLLLLGVAMTGFVLAAEPWLDRLARRPRVWWSVVAVERRVMTVYLWHQPALGIVAAIALWFGGVGLRSYPNSLDWWVIRPLWLAGLAGTVVILVHIFGRAEDPTATRPRSSPMLPLLEVLLIAGLLGLLADRGLGGSDAMASWLLALTALMSLGVLDLLLGRRAKAAAASSRRFPGLDDVRPEHRQGAARHSKREQPRS